MRIHYTEPYLLNPQHKVTVHLVGAGGTGSQMLTCLARINESLVALGHPGLHVRCFDADVVTEANKGRQLFSESDILLNKALVLINRVNRFFGYEWEAHGREFTGNEKANITITCIDTAAGRLDIGSNLTKKSNLPKEPFERPYYWMDLGNTQKTGQIVLGTLQPIKQPNFGNNNQKTAASLPTVTKKFFKELKKVNEKNQGPSCSLAEALQKQDLFINSTLAQLGANILWKLFREGVITHHGVYLNLETMKVNPIAI